MIVVLSKNKVPIRLSPERWEHIERRHPEMKKEGDGMETLKILEKRENLN